MAEGLFGDHEMNTMQWLCICGIAACVGWVIGLILGCLMEDAKDENKAMECTKCREAMQDMAKKLFFARDQEDGSAK